jgi:hypothetical protein
VKGLVRVQKQLSTIGQIPERDADHGAWCGGDASLDPRPKRIQAGVGTARRRLRGGEQCGAEEE